MIGKREYLRRRFYRNTRFEWKLSRAIDKAVRGLYKPITDRQVHSIVCNGKAYI